jgi:hypothetical protein
MQNNINVLWEQYYHTTPLTFWEFVQKFELLKSLFPCVENALKKFDKLSKNLSTYPSEIYIQGAVGIGKGVYCTLIFLYRIYLFLLLKDPYEALHLAPSVPIHAVFIGPRANQTLKGIVNFIESAGSTVFGITQILSVSESTRTMIINYSSEPNLINFWAEKGMNNEITFRSKYGNSISLKVIKSAADLIGTQPLISYFESSDSDLYKSLINRVGDRLGLAEKIMFSTIIVDKEPNNLYSDILDQTIQEKENCINTLVERFVPLFYKDCYTAEDKLKVESCYKISLDSGKIVKANTDTDGSNWVKFPKMWNNINLFEKASENPEVFIRDIIGLPILAPFSCEYKITDALSALQTVRKLIKGYNMQMTFEKNGFYLSVPELDTKLKVY